MREIYINGRFLTQPLKGVQRFAIEMTREMVSMGVPVRVITPDDATHSDLFADQRMTTGGGLRGHLWEQISLPRFLKERGAPLLLNFGNTAPISYSSQIVTIHDVAFVRFPGGYSRSFRTYYRLLIPRLIKRARATLTVSEFSRKEILDAYPDAQPERIHVTYNAANTHFNPSQAAPNPLPATFLTFASDSDLKNYSLVLKAFSDLSRSRKIHLRVVGNSKRFVPEETATANGSSVTLLGRLDDRDLKLEYQRAEAFIFPPHYAGFGIPPIEAQACGCPVIASRAASLPEVLRDSAIYFSPTSATELADAMRKVLDDKQLASSMRNAGYANVKRFKWRESAVKLMEIVERC